MIELVSYFFWIWLACAAIFSYYFFRLYKQCDVLIAIGASDESIGDKAKDALLAVFIAIIFVILSAIAFANKIL